MIRKLRILVLAALTLVTVHAGATSVLGTSMNPTEIDALLVDGILYNVTFSTGSYNSTYSLPATFLNYQSAAQDASLAIANALNGAGVIGLGGVDCLTSARFANSGCLIVTPFAFHPDTLAVDSEAASWFGQESPWSNSYTFSTADITQLSALNFAGNSDHPSQEYMYAVYTSEGSPVPEPGSVVLFGLGCALLVLARRAAARRW